MNGVLETAVFTFALLVAIQAFKSSPSIKAFLLGSHSLGLIGSLFVVPVVLALRKPATRMAAEISLLSAAGFFVAAIFHHSLFLYVSGMSIGFFCIALQIPLQTHWIRRNYPPERRGRLFGSASFVRAGTSIVFSLAGGWVLEKDFNFFPWLLAIFGLCSLISAFAILRIPSPDMLPRQRPGIFQAMQWVKKDRTFRWILISAMAMGLGVIMSAALRVDYVANADFGLNYSETKVALLTSTFPALMRLGTTFFWGILFDRMNFILLRIILNFLFAVSLFLYFWTDVFWVIALGSILGGIARGGGEILWNLWVTKLAPADHVADYMSVHTFLTGTRGFAAPFIGFYIATGISIQTMVIVCLILVATGMCVLIPLVKSWRPIGE